MDKELEYYLNNQKSSCCTPVNKEVKCLSKQQYLSEFSTDKEKELAQYNLGITSKLQELKDLIDVKVIEGGGVPLDTKPTENNTNHAVTSHGLYKEFQKYALQEDVGSIV